MRIETPPLVLARRLVKLERQGRYEAALRLISDDWRDPEFLPSVDGLSLVDSDEFLLRFGALVGFVGHTEMIEGSQQRSCNILFNVRERFFARGCGEKVAE